MLQQAQNMMKTLTGLMIQLTQLGLGLVGVLLVTYLLLGDSAGPYVGSVVVNTARFVDAVSPAALVAAAVVVGIIYLIRRKG